MYRIHRAVSALGFHLRPQITIRPSSTGLARHGKVGLRSAISTLNRGPEKPIPMLRLLAASKANNANLNSAVEAGIVEAKLSLFRRFIAATIGNSADSVNRLLAAILPAASIGIMNAAAGARSGGPDAKGEGDDEELHDEN
jgi:hypothetical protein